MYLEAMFYLNNDGTRAQYGYRIVRVVLQAGNSAPFIRILGEAMALPCPPLLMDQSTRKYQCSCTRAIVRSIVGYMDVSL